MPKQKEEQKEDKRPSIPGRHNRRTGYRGFGPEGRRGTLQIPPGERHRYMVNPGYRFYGPSVHVAQGSMQCGGAGC